MLTAEQIQAIRNQGAEYDEETRTISWAPGTLKAGEKAEFTFAVNVKSQEELAKYPNKRLFGSNVSQPNSVSSWCQLVLEFLRHIAARYGLDVIKTWKFGLWNQPNTDNNLFGFSKEQDFFEFYKETYICLKGFCNDLEFCLPPTFYIVSDEYENWYLHFLD